MEIRFVIKKEGKKKKRKKNKNEKKKQKKKKEVNLKKEGEKKNKKKFSTSPKSRENCFILRTLSLPLELISIIFKSAVISSPTGLLYTFSIICKPDIFCAKADMFANITRVKIIADIFKVFILILLVAV